MTASPLPAPAAGRPLTELGGREKAEILLAILLGLLLGALDHTIVGVALPSIVADLRGTDLYTWTVTIYLLTSTISVPFWGKLSDVYGRKAMLVTGIAIFLAGSVLCGLSGDMGQLIAFRGIQGIGAGSLFPIALAVIGDLFTPAERGKYQGVFAAVFGLAALAGPALGGVLTDALGWHAIFFINLPVGAVSLAVIWRVMPPLRREGIRHRLDIPGAIVFTAAVAPFLIGLTNAQDAPWNSPQVGGLIALGLGIFGLFLFVERRAAEPIIPLELFRRRTFAASIAATFLASLGFFAAIVFLPLYFQVVLGRSATESGYLTFPLLLGVIAGSIGSGQLVARTGRYRTLILGALVLVAVGSALMTLLRADTDYRLLSAWMLLLGLGIGPTLAVFTIVVQNAVEPRDLGAATSALTFFRQVGGSVGLAFAGALFGSQLVRNVPEQLAGAGVPPAFAEQFARAGFDRNDLGAGVDLAATLTETIRTAPLPPALRDQALARVPTLVDGILDAMAITIGQVFWLGVGAAALAFVATLLIRELPLRSGAGDDAGGDRRLAQAPPVPASDGPEPLDEGEVAVPGAAAVQAARG